MAALLARQAAQALRAKQTVRIILALSARAPRFQIPRNLLADSQIKACRCWVLASWCVSESVALVLLQAQLGPAATAMQGHLRTYMNAGTPKRFKGRHPSPLYWAACSVRLTQIRNLDSCWIGSSSITWQLGIMEYVVSALSLLNWLWCPLKLLG